MENFRKLKIDGYVLDVGDMGTIKLNDKELPQTENETTGGYTTVSFGKRAGFWGYYVHRLVAMAWIPNPNNFQYVDHINDMPYDNRMVNLKWVTRKENNSKRHCKIKSKYDRSRKGGHYEITNGNDTHVFNKQTELADFLGVSRQNIIYCINNGWKVCRKWTIKYVKEN